MAKTYKYEKFGKQYSVSVSDEISEFLEKNHKITGEPPCEFISYYVEVFPELDAASAIEEGIKDDVSFVKMYEKYGRIVFDYDYKKVNENLIKLTEKLPVDQDLIDKYTKEVTDK